MLALILLVGYSYTPLFQPQIEHPVWREGLLVFAGEPLSEVIDEVSRYTALYSRGERSIVPPQGYSPYGLRRVWMTFDRR